MLVAKEPDDAVEVRLCGLHLERISDVRFEEDAAHLVDGVWILTPAAR